MLQEVNSGWLLALALFPPFDAPFRRLDGTPDGLLNEVGSEISFFSQLRVEGVSRS